MSTRRPFSIGIAGLGTVGCGVIKLLRANADVVRASAGRPIQIAGVTARRRGAGRAVSIDRLPWFDSPIALASAPGLDCFVEMIGGSEGPAKEAVEAALGRGVSVVTANKALLAEHGNALAALAAQHGAALAYEPAVAGGIPAMKTLKEGLAGNAVKAIAGILNGTCNFILTEMRQTGRDFTDVLGDAHRLGYAEADPSFDIDGIDAAHKLALLAATAFGTSVRFGEIKIEGIRHVSAMDIKFAAELGYRVKLLATARPVAGRIDQRVQPVLVPEDAPLAAVEGVFNAVLFDADPVGQVTLVGRGAGAGPTASAVVADLIDLACGRRAPVFGTGSDIAVGAAEGADTVSPCYMRLMVADRPGVIAEVGAALRDGGLSIHQLVQHGRATSPDDAVAVLLTTHPAQSGALDAALHALAKVSALREEPRVFRIEGN